MKSHQCLLVFCALLFSGWISAQPMASGTPKVLIPGSEENIWTNPTWSPDGKMIAYSSANFNGIWIADENGLNSVKITGDTGAGFGYSWSADSKSLLARPSIFENRRRFHQVKIYHIEDQSEKVILEKTRALNGLPAWTQGDSKVVMVIGDDVLMTKSGKPIPENPTVLDEKENLRFNSILYSARPIKKGDDPFNIFEGKILFNKSFSPDGKKMIFQVGGKGQFVSDPDGSNLKNLGFGEQGTWMPDGRYIISTFVEDDHHNITAAQLKSIDIGTGETYDLLVDEGIIPLNPCVSPEGKQLLFNDGKTGSIYLLSLGIK